LFLIFDISQIIPDKDEQLGSKEKFWLKHPELDRCLFKENRSLLVGEDWSEKIAAEVCSLIQLPHAKYELAIANEKIGIISPSFLNDSAKLILGNEILTKLYLDEYPQDNNDLSKHTIDRIFDALTQLKITIPYGWTPIEQIIDASDVFVGYLLLDAWIGNSDRHHENWGIIDKEKKLYLAPTYDHASSLGRNITDRERTDRLNTTDRGYSISAYADRCKSLIFDRDGKQMKTFDAFVMAARLRPRAASVWLTQLRAISDRDILDLFQRIPTQRISEPAIDFARSILNYNRMRLIEWGERL
jgi:hypothetical protein